MTSAFFVPDITLQDEDKRGATEQAGPSLSKDARHVLDRVCKHHSHSCTVCSKISSTEKRISSSKVRITVEDTRTKTGKSAEWQEEPTSRPSMPPGNALLIAIKVAREDLEELRKRAAG